MKKDFNDEVINLAEEEIKLSIEQEKKKKDVIGPCPFSKIEKKRPLSCPFRGEHCGDKDTNLSQCAHYAVLTERLVMEVSHQIRAGCASCRRVEINDHWLKREKISIPEIGHIPPDIWEKLLDFVPLAFCSDCQPEKPDQKGGLKCI